MSSASGQGHPFCKKTGQEKRDSVKSPPPKEESVVLEGRLGWQGAIGHTLDAAPLENIITEQVGVGEKVAPGQYNLGPVRITISPLKEEQ